MEDLNKKNGGVEGVQNVVERLQAEMGKVLEGRLNGGVMVDEGEEGKGRSQSGDDEERLEELERVKENEKKSVKFEDW